MRIYIFIILSFLYLFGFSQSHLSTFVSQNKTLVFLSKDLAVNTLDLGLILKLRASLISEDSLTYNSSGHLVTGFSGVNVDLDGSSDVAINNSVRFGIPTSGTIYQIADTGASKLNLALDQNFTGNITDEFYWGGAGKWYDESGNENHAAQSTGIRMPKLISHNTDSSKVLFTNGLNTLLIVSDNATIQNIFDEYASVYCEVNLNGAGQSSVGNILNKNWLFYTGIATATGVKLRLYVNFDGTDGFWQTTDETILFGNDYKVMIIYNSSSTSMNPIFYINGIKYTVGDGIDEVITPVGTRISDVGTDLGIGNSIVLNRDFDGTISQVRIYNRELSEGESKSLTE